MNKRKNEWYYANNGQKNGPHTKEEIEALIQEGELAIQDKVWHKDFEDWMPIETTEFKIFFNSPPPLIGDDIKNGWLWFLAFAPVIGFFLEYVVAYSIYDTEDAVVMAMHINYEFWYITLILNIILCVLDERSLEKAGHDTSKFSAWTFIVPVYIFQRAKKTKTGMATFWIWIICFTLYMLE
jgi:hypothetical protein